MNTSFSRSLGHESGVQLNRLIDGSEIPSTGNADQSFAIAMRATRGRIDKAFAVNAATFYTRLGYGESMRSSSLNEAWIQTFEALNNGANQAVVARLVGTDAKLSWVTATLDETTGAFTFGVESGATPLNYTIAVKHLECYNDGIYLKIHADELREGGANVANNIVTLSIFDAKDTKLYEFKGSLDPAAKDDYGNSNYLPDIVESQTSNLEVLAENVAVPIVSTAYGFDENGNPKSAKSEILSYFTEGTVGNYATSVYVAARERLERTQLEYEYIASGGSQAAGLLTQLATLADNTNKQFRFDISGALTPEAVIAFMESLNISGSKSSHLIHAYWAPLKTNDPSGINGKGYYGTSALNIAYACSRNAVKDAKGFAPKNYPIAGKNYPVNRSGVVQTYTPNPSELSKLAAAKVNPVVYEKYSGGGLYVFLDSLTCAPVTNSLRKLIAVAEMSTTIDAAVTAAAKDYLQLPMAESVKKMNDWIKPYFEGAQTAGWIVPSNDPQMGGASFKYAIAPNAANPYDKMDVQYWLHYDGTNRQTFVTQTITR